MGLGTVSSPKASCFIRTISVLPSIALSNVKRVFWRTSWGSQTTDGVWLWVPQTPLGGVGFPVLVFVVDRWAIDRWVTCDLVVLWVTGLYHLSQLFGFLLTLIDVIKPMVLSHPWPVPSWSISSFSLYCLSFTVAALSLPFPVKLSAPVKSFRKHRLPRASCPGLFYR